MTAHWIHLLHVWHVMHVLAMHHAPVIHYGGMACRILIGATSYLFCPDGSVISS